MSRLFSEAVKAEGLKGDLVDLAWGIYSQESGAGKNTKTSNRGAVGGMQVTPIAFKDVAEKDWNNSDPMHNMRAGLRYLKKMYDQAGGDPSLAAAGYYGGPRGLEKARLGIAVKDPVNPNAPDTLTYGAQVVARMKDRQALEAKTPARPQTVAVPPVAAVGAPVDVPSAPVPSERPPNVVMGKSGNPLPPELLAYLSSRGKPVAPTPVARAGATEDPWQAFLNSTRKGGVQLMGADAARLQAPDLDFIGSVATNQRPMAMAMAPVATPRGVVDFSAFGNLVRKAPRV